MRVLLAIAACGLAGCNLVFGLDAPSLGDAGDDHDGMAVDARHDGDDTDAEIDAPRMMTGITAVVAGSDHTCVIRDEAVQCWGANASGQLGYANTVPVGDDEDGLAAGEVRLGAGEVPIQLSAGDLHTCALLASGDVRCWGEGLAGRLGLGDTETIGNSEVPGSVPVVELPAQASAVAAGRAHTCVVMGGQVRCWGLGSNGALGHASIMSLGDDESVLIIGDVPNIGTAVAVAAGDDHTCALRSNGTVTCWGLGADGRLGYGNSDTIGDNEPASGLDVTLGGAARQVVAGGAHTCALLNGGAVRCWGDDSFGQLGLPGATPIDIGDDETPAAVPAVDLGGTAMELAAGRAHTCALLSDGGVVCWGRNDHGQLGYGNVNTIGDNEAPSTAGTVPVGGVVQHITAGGDHTCVLLSSAQVRCWGAGQAGQLGGANQNNIGDDELPNSVPPIGP